MDLSVNTKNDDQVRTIFEDAEYFSKGYSYKLMPITFESVNETIIHIEHNYCHWIQSDEPKSNESHNSTIHEEAEERNYKKRKIKSSATDNNGTGKDDETEGDESLENTSSDSKCEELQMNTKADDDCAISVQPLDLSLPLLQEQKTDKMLTENQSNIPKIKPDTKTTQEKKQLNLHEHESNKENVTSPSKKIEVTISRPGQKEYYEPCEVFLNDLARISPDLIKNDCREIEIIDRTHSQNFQKEVNRTYYIVLESTWRIFENSTDRIILTNDLNIGQPVQNDEEFDKLRYLIFDQHSLTESLAKICESKGGSFEYTCLEAPKEQLKLQDNGIEEPVISYDDNGKYNGSDCLQSDINVEPESVCQENKHSDDTNTDEEGTEKVSGDRASNLKDTNHTETTILGNADDEMRREDEAEIEQLPSNNPSKDEKLLPVSEVPSVSENKGSATQLKDEAETEQLPPDNTSKDEEFLPVSEVPSVSDDKDSTQLKDEAETEQLPSDDTSKDEELPPISGVPSVSEDKDSTQLKNENETCDCNSSTEPVKSVELNLVLIERINVPVESKEIVNKFCDSGSNSLEGATELKCELVNDEKCASDVGRGESNSFSHSGLKGTKRVRVSKESSCAIAGKIKKLNSSTEEHNMTENEKVQMNPENVDERGKTEEDPNSSFRSTRSKDAQPLGEEETAKSGKIIRKRLTKSRTVKETSVKVADVRETKRKSPRIKSKIATTDIKTRSSKEVSVLRNGKQRCPPSAKAKTSTANEKQEREKIDPVKNSKSKSERTEETLKTRARTRKSTSEESKRICLRKRT